MRNVKEVEVGNGVEENTHYYNRIYNCSLEGSSSKLAKVQDSSTIPLSHLSSSCSYRLAYNNIK